MIRADKRRWLRLASGDARSARVGSESDSGTGKYRPRGAPRGGFTREASCALRHRAVAGCMQSHL